MPKDAFDFLDSERIGVIAVEMEDASPHGATVHFAYQRDPLTLVFLTSRASKKLQPILAKGQTRASFVVGTNEELMRTLQFDGVASLAETEECEEVYFARFPEKREKFSGPNDVFFNFTPTWWRYTDYKAPAGKRIFNSE